MKCPACDTWVEDDATVCWLCKTPIAARSGAAHVPGAPPAFDPTALLRPRRRGGVLGTAFLVTAIAVVVGAAGFGIWWLTRDTGEAAVDDFLAGDGVEFTSREGGFRATFPTEPERHTEDLEEEGVELTVEVAEDRPGTDYLFAVAWSDVDVDFAAFQRVLPLAFADEIDGEVEQVHGREFPAFHATEVLVESDTQGTWGLLFEVDDRVYTIEVHSKQGERAPFDRFVSSFELIDPEG